MLRNILSLLICVIALGVTPTTSLAASSSSFDYYYFLGTINPRSWDGPYWWGLRSNIEGLVVTHAAAQEIRSDRVGYAALSATFSLLNASRGQVGERALILQAADTQAIPWEPTSTCGKSDLPPEAWIVGEKVRAPVLAPGQATEVTVTLYLNEKARSGGAAVGQITLEVGSL